jgi:hypothetical protein
MLMKWRFDKFVIPLLAAGLFGYVSYQPKFRLRLDMPPAFVDASSSGPAQEQAPEEKIARAYWDCALTEIQWKYSRVYLPPYPPPEFKITGEDLGAAATDSGIRARYWRKLQEVWYLPSTWKKSYEWNVGWLRDPLVSLRVQFRNYVGKLADF